jgi:hypothetical protein
MKKKELICTTALCVVLISQIFLFPKVTENSSIVPIAQAVVEADPVPVIPAPDPLTHAQEVWLGALEWCESRGVKTAVNKVDRDGTPSYYSFQFKPSTFALYGSKYKLIFVGNSASDIMELMEDYDLTRKIMTSMIQDPGINWEHQFPDCVRKLGRPPHY